VKWVLQYLQGTARLGLAFQKLKTGKLRILQRYVDVDYTRDLDQRRSTTGYVFTVLSTSSVGKHNYKTMALSTTKAEYMTTIEAPKEAL